MVQKEDAGGVEETLQKEDDKEKQAMIDETINEMKANAAAEQNKVKTKTAEVKLGDIDTETLSKIVAEDSEESALKIREAEVKSKQKSVDASEGVEDVFEMARAGPGV